MKHMLRRGLSFLLCLVMLLPTLTAFATPQNHTQSDVTVAQGITEDYRYPAVVNTGNDLLAVFEENGTDGIYASRSTNFGKTWSDPELVISGGNSPDLFAADGMIILTYYGNNNSGAWIHTSDDGGYSWSDAVKLESQILNLDISACTGATQLENGDILFACYGKGDATATGGYHVDSVAVRYSFDGTDWTYVSEALIAQDADEVAIAFTGDDTVWAMTGDSGNVYVSEDNGASWELASQEEPRVMQAKGDMHPECIQHPSFVKVDDERWFVTFTEINTDASKPWEVQGKIVYGKMFYPAYGWDATYSRVLYSGDDKDAQPKGSPVSALTGDGRLISVYYDTTKNAIGGTYSKISDWPSPENESKIILHQLGFESDGSLPFGTSHDSSVTVDGTASTAHSSWRQMIAMDRNKGNLYLSGKHSFQFDFLFDGESGNDLWFRPYYSSTCSVKVRVTEESVGINYEAKSSTGYGYDASAEDTVIAEPVSFDEPLTADTWYTVRCEKDGRTFRVKVWARGEKEPLDWNVIGTHDSKTSDDSTSGVGYYVRYRGAGASIDNLMVYKPGFMTLNKTYIEAEVDQTGSDMQLAANFWPNKDVYTEIDNTPVTFTSNDPDVVAVTPIAATNRAKLTFLKRGAATITASYGSAKATCTVIVHGESEPTWTFHEVDFESEETLPDGVSHADFVTVDGTAQVPAVEEKASVIAHNRTLNIAGKHSFQFDFQFEEDDAESDNKNDLWFRPYNSNACEIKVRIMQDSVGIYKEGKDASASGYDTASGDTVIAEPVEFQERLEAGQWYTVRVEKEGRTFRVKVWARGEEEPLGWDIIQAHDSSTADDKTTGVGYYVRYCGEGVSIDNLKIYKNLKMAMNRTEVTGAVGLEGVKLTAEFTPDLMDAATQLPTPTASDVVFTSSEPDVVDVKAVDGRSDQTELVFKAVGNAIITATVGEISTTCQVYVKPEGTEIATRWEFVSFDFEDWNDRPFEKLTKNGQVALADGVATMTSANPYANIELWKGDSPLQITGKHSFQFNFRFNEDDAANAVWFRPFYNSKSGLKVTVTPEKVSFYNGGYGTGCNNGYTPGDDKLVGEANHAKALEDGVWYTVRCEKDGETLRVKVWKTNGTEPDNWLVTVTDSGTADNGTDPVGFFIRYKGTNGSTMSLDDFVMYKDTEMTIPDAINGSLTLPISELEAVFTSDIYGDLPTPDPVTFTVADESVVEANPVSGSNTKTSLHFLKEGSTTITASLDNFKSVCQVNVVENDGKVSADRWEFFKFDFTTWDTRPISLITKNSLVAVEDGVGTMASGGSYANIELSKSQSPQCITGKFSFQFDFKFNEDDADNAVWFRPYYNSQSDLKVTVTQDKVAFYQGGYGAGCGAGYTPGEDKLLGEGSLALEDGKWYTVRFEREDENMRVRVWARDEDEPKTWSATATDRYTAGKVNDPAGFFIRYKSGVAGNTMNIDNFIMFKDTKLTMMDSYAAGLNLPFVEMKAQFSPDIYAEQPVPPAVNFYTTDPDTVSLKVSEEDASKVVMNFRKTSTEPVGVIAVMEDFFAKCDVTVAENNGQESGNRWNFYEYDFENAKPTNMSVESPITIADGVATFKPDTCAKLEVHRSVGIKRNGTHSFQFDFCFLSDDTGKGIDEQNAVWFRPYYSGRSAAKFTITQDSVAMYEEGSSSVQYGYDASKDKVIMEPIAFDERLDAGKWYTVRVEKESRYFRVKVWEQGTEEPAEWLGEGVNTATTTDSDDLNNPVGYYIRYRGAGMALDNLVMYKYTEMTMKDTVIGGIENKNPLEVEATFKPNIYAEDPTPPQMKFYISDEDVATLTPVDGEANGNKTNLSAKRLTTDADNVTVTAILDDFFGVSKVKVMEIVPDPTTEIGNRLELFVDQELVDMEDEVNGVSDNITFVMQDPVNAGESENPFPRAYYTTVIYDEAFDIYRGYYNSSGYWGQRYCYVESTDGINWYKPSLGIFPEDEKQHDLPNVVISPIMEGNVAQFEHNFSPFLDTSLPVGHPERYKAIAGYGGDPGDKSGRIIALYTLVSPDGIHWSRNCDEPALTFDPGKHEWAFDSQNVVFWSEEEQQYVCYYRHYVTPAGTSYRTVARLTSPDFITWTDEIGDFITPNLNDQTEQLYTTQTAPYFRAPHIYIATAARYGLGNLIGINPATGKNYTIDEATKKNLGATDVMLMTSRAGYNYYIRQFEEAFVRPGLDNVGWTDRRNYPSLNVFPTSEKEMSFFNYDGDRYVLRTDGFVAAHAGIEGGELQTKPVIFSDAEDLALLVNVSTSVRGSLRVELLNQFGEVIPGFERENCVPMTGDWVEKAVVWNGHDVSELVGQDVKVCFVMNDCDLYSYKFDTPTNADLDDIEVIFEQGEQVIYDGTTLEELASMITVNAVMTDGTRNVLRYGDYSLEGTLKPNFGYITVYYGDETTSFRVKVTNVEAVSISAAFDKGKMKSIITMNELKERLTVTGTNNDGSTFVIYPDAYELTGRSAPGATVTVTYKGLTTSLKVPRVYAVAVPLERALSIIDTTYVKTEEGAEATNISDRLELFVDDALVESMSGVSYKIHEPQKAAASENPFPAGSAYTTVIYDEEARLYRGYYRDERLDAYRYAESTDGINWYLPALGIYPDATEPNIILMRGDEDNVQEFEHNFTPFLDTNPDCDPAERYKAVAGYIPESDYKNGQAEGKGLYTLASPDGIHWSRKSDAPVIVYNKDLHGQAFDSQNVVFWSEAEQLYVCYFRHYNTQDNATRTVGRATSEDFITWTDETREFVEPNLKGEQLYTTQTAPYFRAPHIYISTATRYAAGSAIDRPGNTKYGANDIMLMSSRAGSMSFDRLYTEPLMKAGVNEVGWTDRYNYLSLNAVPTGYREMSFYHNNGDRYTLRTDGFASVHAGAKAGELITKPVIFSGVELILNFSASINGEAYVELQKPDGTPYEGFEAENCVEIVGDSVNKAVSWNNADVKSLIGKPVKIRFILEDCDLYSFRFRSADEPQLKYIRASYEQGDTTIYALGSYEQLVPGLTVTATYTDGSMREIPRDGYGIAGALSIGTKTLTVYHETQATVFQAFVTALTAKDIKVEVTDKVTVNMSLAEVKNALKVTGINADGSTFEIHPSAYDITEAKMGSTRIITVTYKGILSDTLSINADSGVTESGSGTEVEPEVPEQPEDPGTEPENPGTEPEQPEEPIVVNFTDVRTTNKYYDAVQFVASKGLMTGITDARFGLNYTVNRATLVTVLWRMENEPTVSYEMSFTDVPAGEWYTEAVRWATANDIVTGIDSSTFSPMAEITKENLLVILYRYAQYKNYDVSAGNGVELKFTDASRISTYAVDAVKWACGIGIIENIRTTFGPKKEVLRGDFAQFIKTFCENANP